MRQDKGCSDREDSSSGQGDDENALRPEIAVSRGGTYQDLNGTLKFSQLYQKKLGCFCNLNFG
jgi:hypothetical protein